MIFNVFQATRDFKVLEAEYKVVKKSVNFSAEVKEEFRGKLEKAGEALQEARSLQQFALRNCFRPEFRKLFPPDFKGDADQKLFENPDSRDLFEARTFQAHRVLSRFRNLLQLLEESVKKGELKPEDVQAILEEKVEAPIEALKEHKYPEGPELQVTVTSGFMRTFIEKKDIEEYDKETLESRKKLETGA